jgi:hypothetical protein
MSPTKLDHETHLLTTLHLPEFGSSVAEQRCRMNLGTVSIFRTLGLKEGASLSHPFRAGESRKSWDR